MGRATQGVKVMNVRDDTVSAVALVVESETEFAAGVAENGDSDGDELTLSGNGAAPEPLDGASSPAAEPDAEI
jgi:hypothetical protein